MELLLIILGWILVIVLFLVLLLMFSWMFNLMKEESPFIPLSMNIVNKMEKHFYLSDDSVLYDLGSGDGRVIFHLAEIYKNTKFIGIEKGFFPFILSKIKFIFLKKEDKKRIKIIYKDFFKEDLSKATHVFTYLKPKIMDDLLLKFDKELKNGTKLFSIYFQFTLKRPFNVISLSNNPSDESKNLYIYEF